MKILFVDDSDPTATLLLMGFEFGPENLVAYAPDGAEALKLMEQSRPDIVVTDGRMPVMDGFELTRRIRADGRYQDVKILMVSGEIGGEKKATAAGVNAFLGKPVDIETVNATIHKFVSITPPAAEAEPQPGAF